MTGKFFFGILAVFMVGSYFCPFHGRAKKQLGPTLFLISLPKSLALYIAGHVSSYGQVFSQIFLVFSTCSNENSKMNDNIYLV